MNRTLVLLLLAGMTVLFSACPYESEVPIDSGKTKVDERFLGTWNKGSENEVYVIARKDDHTYSVVGRENGKEEKYLVSPSEINGTLFFNLTEDKPSASKKYLFYKIELDGNTMRISPVTENVREKFATSEELKRFFGENMKNSYFFEKTGELTRVK